MPLNVCAPVINSYNLATRIQKRLTTIVTYFPERARHKATPQPRPLKPSLESVIAESDHLAFSQGSRVKCARCLHSFHKGDSSVFLFKRRLLRCGFPHR